MQKQTIALITLVALPLTLGSYGRFSSAHAQPLPGTPNALPQDDDRDQARDARHQGHEDGMMAANEDMRNGRAPDADHHEQFRHPPVKGHLRDAYRDGFRDGYNDAYRNGGERRGDDNRPH